MARGVNKYRNKPTTVDGIRFMSAREARYYSDYRLLEKAGEIRQLKLQPKYPIVLNGVKICDVLFDFEFREKDGRLRTIDVKGLDNPMSKLKRRLVEALYPHVSVELVK